MGMPVVSVAAGGLPVVEATFGTPVTEAANGYGVPVTKVVGKPGLPVVFETIGVTPATTMDGATANVTLSNGNLTVTHSSTATDSGARSTALKNSGKWYFECTMTDLEGVNDCCGLLTATGTFANLGAGINCVAVYKGGNIYTNGAFATRNTGAVGDNYVMQWAVDLDTDQFWVRVQTSNWNGDGGGTANPVTGVGGLSCASFSGTTLGPAVGFGGTGTQAGDNVTLNFGATAFVYAMPSGFAAWG